MESPPLGYLADIRIDEQLPATPSSVARARAWVREIGRAEGVPGEQIAEVSLAVTEAVTNVVRHAYPHAGGDLHLTADVAEGVLVVSVRDYGVGISGAPARDGLGLGMHLMRELSQSCEVVAQSPGTLVRLRFALGG